MEEKKEIQLAKEFHNTYERLAPKFGYKTREDTKDFDKDSPNGKLMIAVCKEVMLKELDRAIEEGYEKGILEKSLLIKKDVANELLEKLFPLEDIFVS